MEQKTKNLILFLGAVLVAVIFLSSYLSFNNNNISNGSSTTTIKNVATVFATGNSVGTITNYSYAAYVTVMKGSSNDTTNTITTVLSNLEANGSIEDYTYTNSSFQVVLSSISAYALQQQIYNQTRESNTINVSATADITLPSSIVLYYQGAPANINLQNRNYTVYLRNVQAIGSMVNLDISALLEQNGSIYNNQIQISRT